MPHWERWIAYHPGRVLLGVVLASALALGGIFDLAGGGLRIRLQVAPGLNEMLPDDDAGRRFYQSLIDRFGSDESLVVALHGSGVFTRDGLERLIRLTERLQALDRVHHVESLATALHLRAVEGDLEIVTFLEDLPSSDEGLASLRDTILRDPLRAGSFVARDGETTALVVTFDEMSDEEFLAGRFDLETAEIANEVAGDLEVWIAGTPYVKAEISRILISELLLMVPAILGVMALLSFVFFRSWVGSLAPIASILCALLWTLGVVAWTGHRLNIVTTLVPQLVLILGFAYAVHLVSAHRQQALRADRPDDPREILARALEKVGFPVAFTAFTTAAGFLSLSFNELEVIRGFGLYAVVGVGTALLSTMSVVPALLALGFRPGPRTEPRAEVRFFDRIVARLAAFDLRNRRLLIGVGLTLFGVSVFYATGIRVNTEVIGNFRPDSPLRRSYDAVNEHLGGATSFYVMIESEQRGAFEEPENLHALAAFQDWLAAQPEVGTTTSMVDHLRVIHDAFRDGDGSARSIPNSRKLVAQLLLMGSNEELDKLVDPAHRTATIQLRATCTASEEFAALTARIEERLAELPEGLSGSTTGNAILLTRAADRISRGQAVSLVAASVMIGLIMIVYLRSVLLGLAALVPNVLPVAVYFGALGLTGVTLNNATALMGSIVLGVAVDDTIHFLVHFRKSVRHRGDEARAAQEALAQVARPVTYTTLVLCVGLLIVATSQLETQAQFGALGAFTLAVAWAADVVITPALCSYLPVRPRDPS